MSTEGGRLLVVDDNEMNRDMLSRRLARKGHDVLVADGGEQALEMIEHESFDVVLLDIMMPGIDGFQVLEKIRAEYGAADLPVIMATAKDDSSDVVAALKAGANDYVTKPFDFPVVVARVKTQLALKRSRDYLAAAHERMRRDLEAAARIQQHFLPSEKPDVKGLVCAWRYLPCNELAGDTLNVIPLDDKHVGLAMVDVSGHGVPSALLSVTLSRVMGGVMEASSALWTLDEHGGDLRIATPLEVLRDLAVRFPHDAETRQYFTMAYAVLDLERLELSYVAAGHPGPILIRRGCEPRVLDNTGPPIGLLPSIVPVTNSEGTLKLEPGDRLYIVTDGIPEAEGTEEEEFGMERLTDHLQDLAGQSLEESLDAVVVRVQEWCGDKGPGDDISMLAVEIDGQRENNEQ